MRKPDYKRRLIDYFKKNLAKRYTVDSLRWALVNQGYSRSSVEAALDEANRELAMEAPVLKEKPVIVHEVVDEEGNLVNFKKPWWKRLLGL